MREIHDFEAVKNWRWQITFQGRGGNFVYGSSGSWREIRAWKHVEYLDSGNRDLLRCGSIGSVIFGADFCELLRHPNFVTIRMIEHGSLSILVERRRLLRCDAGEV